jgi:hypothetical protein
MENVVIVLIILLLIGILVLIGLLFYFGHRFLKLREVEAKLKLDQKNELQQSEKQIPTEENKSKPPKKQMDPELLKALRAKRPEPVMALYCVDHPEEISKGVCAISGDSFCEHCLTKQGDIRLAKKYLDLYLDNEWVQVIMFANTEGNQDQKDRIMKLKKHLWQNESLPMIVQWHYKINVEDDQIEEYTVILARKDDQEVIQKELSFK